LKHKCLECSTEWTCKTNNCRVPVEIYCSKCANKNDLMSIITGSHPQGCHISIQNTLPPVELIHAKQIMDSVKEIGN